MFLLKEVLIDIMEFFINFIEIVSLGSIFYNYLIKIKCSIYFVFIIIYIGFLILELLYISYLLFSLCFIFYFVLYFVLCVFSIEIY